MGIGIMIQDSGGEVFACLSASYSFNSQPIFTEHLALWKVTELSQELGLTDV